MNINCGECGGFTGSVEALISHIQRDHPLYTKEESVYYAYRWLDDAIEQDVEAEAKAAADDRIERDIDEAIERDITFRKHQI